MCKLFKFKQLPPPVSVLGLVIASAIALVSCQKENHPSKFELMAEGFSSGNKMAVNAFTSTWSSGDQVRIGNASYTVSVVPRGAGLCRQWQHNRELYAVGRRVRPAGGGIQPAGRVAERRRRLLELTEVCRLLPGRECFSRKKRFAASPLCECDGGAGYLPLSVTG